MAIALTEDELYELMWHAQEQGEPIYQPMDLGPQFKVPKCIGQGNHRIFQLRGGLTIDIRSANFQQSFAVTKQHIDTFPITAKFCLSGRSRVKTSQVPGIADDYEEKAGCSYLYHLPDLVETEEWRSDQPIQVVMVYAHIDYFRGLSSSNDALPYPLQQLMQDTKRFHQPLGRTTPAMIQVLQQILHCPYQGSTQHLYLESKALELLALQFASLESDSPASKPAKLKASDLERVRYVRDILVEQICDPPSFTELVRLAGLNEFSLKQGFHQLFGTTVFGYLYNYRMQQAQMLLRSSEVSIAQVAAQIGYRNPEAFSTAFRRKYAISPKAYQLQQRS
ncbi:MAG: AraC family transcriptional regulator [Cyanobacteria bacterium P01_D01_bin.128]